MRVLMITGGHIDFDFALGFLKTEAFDEVIAADGGLEMLARLEKGLPEGMLRLTHIVGDFDSVDPAVLQAYRGRAGVEIHTFRPEKDYTDTDIALKLAVSVCRRGGERPQDSEIQGCEKPRDSETQGCEKPQIVILGATGTRLDHVLANLQMLKLPMAAGMDAVIADAHNRIRMIEKTFVLRGGFGKYVSLIPVSEVLEGVDLEGFKYPLCGRTVHLGESLCVSNELTEPVGIIRIRRGTALLIESGD